MSFRPSWLPDKKENSRQYDRHARNKESRKIYQSRRWRDVTRPAALLRDLYTCRKCDLPATEVHHVIPVAVDPSKAHDLDNLISLCSRCHRGERRDGGRG